MFLDSFKDFLESLKSKGVTGYNFHRSNLNNYTDDEIIQEINNLGFEAKFLDSEKTLIRIIFNDL